MGIFDFFSGQDAQNAANAQKQGLTTGYNDLSNLIGQANTSLGTTLSNATAAYLPEVTAGTAGLNTYADATGANGAAGTARAVNNFQTSPGYQFDVNQMLQNVLRGQEATGQAASGATNSDIMQQISGLANNQWQSYIQNLQPLLNTANAGASGTAGANLTVGGQLANNLVTQGNAAYGTQAGIGNANANAALAPYNASANFWNLATNLAGDATKLFGVGSAGGAGGHS